MADSRPTPTRGGFNGWWLGSAMFVLAVLVAAVLVVVLGGRGSSGNQPPSAAGGPGPSATGSSPSGGSPGCSLGAGDVDVPTSQAPSGIHWEIVNTVAVPWSSTAGPAVRDGAIRRCYLHSPTGALLAAANLAVTTESPGADQVLRDQVLPGPTRDAKLQAAQTQPPQAKQAGETAAIAGYRFVSYTPQAAMVQLAYAFGGKYGAETYRLEWQGGDWKLNLDPADGSAPGGPLGGLAGFVPWGAV